AAVTGHSREALGLPAPRMLGQRDRVLATSTAHRPRCAVLDRMNHVARRQLGDRRLAAGLTARLARPRAGGSQVARPARAEAIAGLPVRAALRLAATPARGAPRAANVATAVAQALLVEAGIRQLASTAARVTAAPSVRPATGPVAVAVPQALSADGVTGPRRTTSRPGARGRPGEPRSRFLPARIPSCSIPRSARSCAHSASSPLSLSVLTWQPRVRRSTPTRRRPWNTLGPPAAEAHESPPFAKRPDWRLTTRANGPRRWQNCEPPAGSPAMPAMSP
ncbi:MAG: hypothetical protein QOI26_2545, partial [Pseudonocardiales bacterium]|nr:hypothetical protein [Pseudonocardiales bacterium]